MTYPPLPDIPACWSWPVPPLPQPSHLGVIVRWQAWRCAICGLHRPPPDGKVWGTGLFEDHDHITGDTRGYLCPRCNAAEGHSPRPVFELYRERHPAAILGVLVRKGCVNHPLVRSAEIGWERALDNLEDDRRERELEPSRAKLAPIFEQLFGRPQPLPQPSAVLSPDQREYREEIEALKEAAARVGLTQAEWFETLGYRLDAEWDLRFGHEVRPHPLWERLRIKALFSEEDEAPAIGTVNAGGSHP